MVNSALILRLVFSFFLPSFNLSIMLYNKTLSDPLGKTKKSQFLWETCNSLKQQTTKRRLPLNMKLLKFSMEKNGFWFVKHCQRVMRKQRRKKVEYETKILQTTCTSQYRHYSPCCCLPIKNLPYHILNNCWQIDLVKKILKGVNFKKKSTYNGNIIVYKTGTANFMQII